MRVRISNGHTQNESLALSLIITVEAGSPPFKCKLLKRMVEVAGVEPASDNKSRCLSLWLSLRGYDHHLLYY